MSQGVALAPLSARVYLARNLRRVAPVLGIQALVTCLLVAAITPTNAFEATTQAYVASRWSTPMALAMSRPCATCR